MLFCFVLHYTHEQQCQILCMLARYDWGQALPVIFFSQFLPKWHIKAFFSSYLFYFFLSCSESVVIERTDLIRCLESSSPIDTVTEAGAWHLSGSNPKMLVAMVTECERTIKSCLPRKLISKARQSTTKP